MYNRIKPLQTYWINAILNSYAQVFFSKNKTLSVILLIVSLFQPFLGLMGLISVAFINLLAYYLGYNKETIQDGLFGFNALFLGMAFAYDYKFSFAFCIALFFFLVLIFLFIIFFKNLLSTFKIPYISSLPFVIVYAFAHLILSYFDKLYLQEDKVYIINYQVSHINTFLYTLTHFLDNDVFPLWLSNYCKTLSLIVFNNSVFIGLMIALGLLCFSRIVFSLSIIGYLFPHFFHSLIGLNESLVNMPILNLNYILVCIAIGSFYVVPNIYSYLLAITLTTVLLVLFLASSVFFAAFQINSFTFSSSFTIILFLFFLNTRDVHKYIFFPYIQYFSPEKTIYKYVNSVHRFRFLNYLKINLPFWGKWQTSQGYNGTITHLGEWGKALDFMVVNDDVKTYKNEGLYLEDFYSFNKPILAPLDGKVHTIINNVNDNIIGEINTEQNWGNTIIIEHTPYLYSQISHIKKDSFKVSVGDFVTKETILAMCGNSGRSPEPHIHFQMQTEPKVGAKPIFYPIAYFLEENKGNVRFCMSEIPRENTVVWNIESAPLLNKAFDFKPGQIFTFINTDDENDKTEWEVFSDAYNRSYIYCKKTQSTLWFHKDNVLFYSYDFEGSKKALLFDFYLALYKVLLSCQTQFLIKDTYPLDNFNHRGILFIQDFLAPFYRFTNAQYTISLSHVDNIHSPQKIILTATTELRFFKSLASKKKFEIEIKNNKMNTFSIHTHNTKKSYLLCS